MKMKTTLALTAAIALLATGCGQTAAPNSTADTSAAGTESAKVSDTAAETTTAATTEAAAEVTEEDDDDEIPEIPGYNLIWHDEFQGEVLDNTIWSYDPHEPGWTNEELQEYTQSTDNVFLRGGHLVLKAIKSDQNGKDYYTSGKVKTQNKQDFTYGKVVARAKVPEGQGLWPAIWMMPTDESRYGQWPKCGEIDIMEVLGSQTDTAYGTVHYGEPHSEQQGKVVLNSGTFGDKFHEYSVEWEPGEMRWYIDGELYNTVNDWFTADASGEEKPYPAPFDQPFFVQLNLAVGGTWPGNPDATTNFDNAEFEVDYVRVYQKESYDTNVSKPETVWRPATGDGNFIYNGDFAEAEDLEDDVNWKFMLFEGGQGSAEIRDNAIVISTEDEGTVDYSVQLVQAELPMRRGKTYRLTFDAYSVEERKMIVCVSAPTAGWIRYLQDTPLTVNTEKQTFAYEFEMHEKDDPNGRLEFNLGHCGSTGTVYIENVRIEEV